MVPVTELDKAATEFIEQVSNAAEKLFHETGFIAPSWTGIGPEGQDPLLIVMEPGSNYEDYRNKVREEFSKHGVHTYIFVMQTFALKGAPPEDISPAALKANPNVMEVIFFQVEDVLSFFIASRPVDRTKEKPTLGSLEIKGRVSTIQQGPMGPMDFSLLKRQEGDRVQ